MYEEAAPIASSVLRSISEGKIKNSAISIDGFELHDMMTSAGMVLVQSLNQLGRYPLYGLHLFYFLLRCQSVLLY